MIDLGVWLPVFGGWTDEKIDARGVRCSRYFLLDVVPVVAALSNGQIVEKLNAYADVELDLVLLRCSPMLEEGQRIGRNVILRLAPTRA